MTDHDDKVTRRYRELAREEPSAALDAAILAASRRAVARPSAASRWGPPLSIAAVLMLAVGVTLNMQREQPGVEYMDPARSSAPPPAAAPEPAPVPQVAPVQSPRREDARPALRARKAAPPAGSREEQFVASPPPAKSTANHAEPAVKEKKDNALSDLSAQRLEQRTYSAPQAESAAPPPAAASAPAAGAPVAKTTRDAAEALQAAPAQAPAEMGRAKREADSMGITSTRAKGVIIDPAPELERIARLRAEGRHAEADKALEEFRRRHPGFRIPDAMWERVKAKGEGEQPPSPPR